MQTEKRFISRKGWQRVLKSSSAYMLMDYEPFHAVAGLLCLEKTSEPLVKTIFGRDIIIADDGYYWMQIAPQDENWWLTVMLDREKHIVQYYFDITKQNVLCGEESYFRDMFLDVAALPDGTVLLLDKDELDAALTEGVIGDDEYRLAVQTADMLMKEVPENIGRLERFSYNLFSDLERRL